MRRSIATVCLSGTLEDKLAAAAAAGFDGVEVFENDLIASPLTPRRIRARCAELGLSVDLYQPFRDFEAVGPRLHERALRRAERKFDLMEQLGAPMMLVCSSVSPDAVDDDDLAAGELHALAERAAARGLKVAYEALAWGRHVDTWEHSAEIVRRAGHPALGLCLDSFHVLSRGGDLGALSGFPGEKLFFLQLSDAPWLRMDVLQWSRHYRLFPGQGGFDLAAFVSRVLAAGYRGPLSLEVFNDVFRQSAPDRAAVDAMRSLITLEEDLGRRHPEAAAAVRDPAAPPSAPEPAGYAFVELAVGGTSGPQIAQALAAMGFAHAGRHRSRPVELWQQGGARVLLDSGAAAAGERTEVSALAVGTGDPARAARRAEALLTPAHPPADGSAGTRLTSVNAPDGTRVFFCRTGADAPGGWLGDFLLTGAGHASPAGLAGLAGLTGIDHVALSQPFDFFDEATLFYRSLLGLDPQHDAEYAAPFGLVRSRAVADAGRRVRIVLDGTVLRRGTWAPGVPDPQHIAFATDDIFATARVLRERGAPLLAVSENYYDDLDARLAPDPELLAAMRECHVLYDRDEHGEFFHTYTAVLGSRIFFEVVQRVGGYAGYGAVNAPVRMAAHHAARTA
ncbi:sugar phosphate isomerase/epimerase and 4-hydroxyphenylpyruvate domain-containing protein [Streptomyces armeniacus]|uniref:3-dehydroshikimate dehydratase n=1 Tax=Streptomyces armeniacus TaxID=83291 RepID=A0A345XLG8_9ACTN|nr:sugar phosphate isomerase/epimerase and 4-hydroxyphenylpyruvate domain-containing protein [Streptomyces armeniacus]AXK32484.1 sugar phosphate isomerase/epimerase and 4-hydroxyphenylpyruvate domain-containing protein [Streptomyces armeniacus]